MTTCVRVVLFLFVVLHGGCSPPDWAANPEPQPVASPLATSPPVATRCGDGIVSGGESCDDGINDGRYGHCVPGCFGRGPSCGDGIVQAEHEACDDAINDGRYGGCRSDCSAAGACGDGRVDPGEACDDANEADGDGCNRDCRVSGSVVWTREVDAGPGRDVVAQRGGRVVLATEDGEVRAFDRDGWPLWEAELSGVEVTAVARAADTAWVLGQEDGGGGARRLDREGLAIQSVALEGVPVAAVVDGRERLVVAEAGRVGAWRDGATEPDWTVAPEALDRIDAIAAAVDGGVLLGGPPADATRRPGGGPDRGPDGAGGDGRGSNEVVVIERRDDEGALVWVAEVDCGGGARLSADASGLWVGCRADGMLVRLDGDGREAASIAAEGVDAIASIGGGDVLVVGDGQAARITPSGERRWSTALDDAMSVVGVVIDDEGRAFVAATRADESTVVLRLAA